ncbi:hypothetical protein D3C81_1891960 [compost metagenome]
MIELNEGEFEEDFNTSQAVRLNTKTNSLEFLYTDPSNLESQDLVFSKPLSTEIAELKAANSHTMQAITDLTMTLAAMTT